MLAGMADLVRADSGSVIQEREGGSTLLLLRLPCEICGTPTELPRAEGVTTATRPGSFGQIASRDPASKHFDGALSDEAAEANAFWACVTCHAEVQTWDLTRLRERLTESRTRHPNPAELTVEVPSRETPTRRTAGGRGGPKAEVRPVDAAMEQAVGVSLEDLAALYVLDELKGMGPQKFKDLHERRLRPADVLRDPNRLPTEGKRGDDLRRLLQDVDEDAKARGRERARRQILAAHQHQATLLTYAHPSYPRNVYESNNPMPVLYVRGSLEVLAHRDAVACVGSRKIRPPYLELHDVFARTACKLNQTVISGFAVGADTVGHRAAAAVEGRTICVMPSGLDRPFPPENRELWAEFLRYSGAALVSEFPFGTPASAMTLRKRNKLIVAFARGVLVSQSAADGGAMNAFRFAIEQHKPVATFEADGSEETSGNLAIAKETKIRVAVLPHDATKVEVFERWLRGLCSSI